MSTWTSTRPTSIGFYWMRINENDNEPRVVELEDWGNKLGVQYCGSVDSGTLEAAIYSGCLWFGPILPPPLE